MQASTGPVTHRPKGLPVADYLLAQGRFKHLTKRDLERIQKEVDSTWEELVGREARAAPSLTAWSFLGLINGGFLPPPHSPDKSGAAVSPTDKS